MRWMSSSVTSRQAASVVHVAFLVAKANHPIHLQQRCRCMLKQGSRHSNRPRAPVSRGASGSVGSMEPLTCFQCSTGALAEGFKTRGTARINP